MMRRFAFTIVEVLVVIAILAILVLLCCIGIGQARAAARALQCGSNLKQIGAAVHQFHSAHGRMPDATELLTGLGQYGSGLGPMFHCPDMTVGVEVPGISYGANPCVRSHVSEADKVILVDANADLLNYETLTLEQWIKDMAARHGGLMNVLFGDGRVERRLIEELNPYLPVGGEEIRRRWWKPRRPGCTCDSWDGNGLLGEYWADPYQWSGPAVRRIEKTITLPFGNLDFYHVPYNVPLVGATASCAWPLKTARFSGLIKADCSEPYTFHVCCDNEAWIYVNGQLVVSRSTGGPGPVQQWQAASLPIDLRAGQWVDFEVRWRELHPSTPSHIMVQWSSPSSPCRTQIPLSNMRPPRWSSGPLFSGL